MTVLGAVVEWDSVLEVIWASLAAGIGVTVAACAAIVGGTRFADAHREGSPGGRVLYGVLATLGLVAIAGALVLGILVMAHK